jgi:Glycosyl hydrolase family 12
MAATRKPRKLVPLAAVLCLLVAAAFGGYLAAGSRAPETVNLAGAPGTAGSGHDVTVYACLASGTLTDVSMTAPTCPAKAVPVQWVAQRDPSSPGLSPSPSPGSSSPSAGPSPTLSGHGAPCVAATLAGTCGPYADSDITDADGYNTSVANNMWGCGSVQPGRAGAYCGRQTVTAYGPGDWSVTSDQAAGNTGVLAYPDVAQVFTLANDTDPPITGFSAITSSFTEAMNATSKTDAEAAYDIWLGDGNGPTEIMIWVDNHGQTPAGNDKGSVVIGGTTYELWNGGGTISFVRSNEQSGTVDILAVLRWLQSHGYVHSNADLSQVDFGWEICSTGGAPETFTVSSYTLRDTCGSACSG